MTSTLSVQAETAPLLDSYLQLMDAMDVTEVIGRDVLEAGLQQLAIGVLPLAAELVALEARGRSLAEAVNDPDGAPHIVSVHGLLEDILSMKVPSGMQSWASRVSTMPTPDVRALSHGLANLALGGTTSASKALGRFIVFEILCLVQRLALHESGESLELVGGNRGDIEAVAEEELRQVESRPALSRELLSEEDPVNVLGAIGLVSLTRHVEALKHGISGVDEGVRDWLGMREKVLELEAVVAPVDAVILRNETASLFDEERLSAAQLRKRHPGHLAGLSDAGVYKRKQRLQERIQNDDVRPAERGGTLLDVLLGAGEEPN